MLAKYQPIQKNNTGSLKERGVVLIMVLVIVTAISLASVSVLESSRLNIERVARIQDVIQARELLNMGREWVSLIIFEDMIQGPKDNRDFDNFEDSWAEELGSPIAGEAQDAEMEIKIEDAQGKFNLNNLLPSVDDNNFWFDSFVLLLQSTAAGADVDPKALATALRDWIDDDTEVGGIGGAEDGDYFRKETPYRSANRPLTNLGELNLIEGFTPEIIGALKEHVIALPIYEDEPTLININTCSEEVFATLVKGGFDQEEIDKIFDKLPEPPDNVDEPELTPDEIENTLPQGLPEEGADVQDILDEVAAQGHENASGPRFEREKDRLEQLVQSEIGDNREKDLLDHYDVHSDYFIVTITVTIDEVKMKERIVMSRYANKAKGAINLSSNSGNTRKAIIKYVQTNRIL